MDPEEVARTLRRFYGCAEQVLFPEAVIDKLIDNEVMALYLCWPDSDVTLEPDPQWSLGDLLVGGSEDGIAWVPVVQASTAEAAERVIDEVLPSGAWRTVAPPEHSPNSKGRPAGGCSPGWDSQTLAVSASS